MKDYLQDFIDRASCREALRLWARVQANQKLIARRAEREEAGTPGIPEQVRLQLIAQAERIERKPGRKRAAKNPRKPRKPRKPREHTGLRAPKRAVVEMTQEEMTAYLRGIWKESGLSQNQFCKEVGISDTSFSRYLYYGHFPNQAVWEKIQAYRQRKAGGMAA